MSLTWILSKVLAEAGFAVVTAEALAIAAHSQITAAIIDYRLPDKSGLVLFGELRRCQLQLPAVLITSYGSGQLRDEALRLGFHAYLDKPLDNRALIATLRAILKEA